MICKYANSNTTVEIYTWFSFNSFNDFKQEHFRVTEQCNLLYKKWVDIIYVDRYTKSNIELSNSYSKYYRLAVKLNKFGNQQFNCDFLKDRYIQSNLKL